MSQEDLMQAQHPAEIPSYVHLFQKAHQNIGLLEQIDEQLAQLWTRRQDLQHELRTLQAEITSELEDWITSAGEPPKQILSAMMEAGKHAGNGAAPAPVAGPAVNLPPLAQRAGPPRFATQPLTSATQD